MSEVIVTAKKIEWKKDGSHELYDEAFGFVIIRDDTEHKDYRYAASWNECDTEHFSLLREAKEWCQSEIDTFIRDNAVVTEV